MSTIEARFKLHRPGFTLDVDLRLPGQGITALFGASGSGKTTLLRCVAGLERAPAGRPFLGETCWQDDGADKRRWVPTHRRDLGYVFQEASLLPHLTVMGNLRFGMTRAGHGSAQWLDQAVDLLGIGHLLDRRPQSLSGGERQRVGMARALAVGPRLLLMDEPLAALDLQRKQEVMPYLERLHRESSIPILYVTHAADEVATLADHLVVMDGGRALASGPVADMLTRVDLPIRLGEDAGAILDVKVGALDEPWHLARVDFDGGALWTQNRGLQVGQAARVRVLARDVSLAVERPTATSIQNVLEGQIEALADDGHPALALVRVRIGHGVTLARLTRRSAASLGIAVGSTVWAQVKSVALLK